jgi:hypothetical protein
MIIPSNMGDIGGMVASLGNLLERGKSSAAKQTGMPES